jgi:hypothetical protein
MNQLLSKREVQQKKTEEKTKKKIYHVETKITGLNLPDIGRKACHQIS